MCSSVWKHRLKELQDVGMLVWSQSRAWSLSLSRGGLSVLGCKDLLRFVALGIISAPGRLL